MNAPLPKETLIYFAYIEVEINRTKYAEDFHEWLKANWHVYEAFAREADKVWARGRTHYSARTIIEYLRHETSVRETGDEWKINDHFTPSMARLYFFFHPQKTLFEFRGKKAA
jgi:hypothetical protein